MYPYPFILVLTLKRGARFVGKACVIAAYLCNPPCCTADAEKVALLHGHGLGVCSVTQARYRDVDLSGVFSGLSSPFVRLISRMTRAQVSAPFLEIWA